MVSIVPKSGVGEFIADCYQYGFKEAISTQCIGEHIVEAREAFSRAVFGPAIRAVLAVDRGVEKLRQSASTRTPG